MFSFIRIHQLNIMLSLCSICTMMAILVLFTRFLPKRRKWILFSMEIIATLLLAFDRMAYIHSGDPSHLGWIMVRLSNFMVFFLTSCTVFCFNFYIYDLLTKEAKVHKIPRRLNLAGALAVIGMVLIILNLFTGFIYSFDQNNHYHRQYGFLLSYMIPVLVPLIQFSIIIKYRNSFSKFIFTALFLYIFLPIGMGILQIFFYGISIVNMAMVLVSICLYIFSYLDINEEVEKLHLIEMNTLKAEHESMKKLFDQTASAFVNAIERGQSNSLGISRKTAELARKIAEKSGENPEECEKAYYVALLYNAGIPAIPQNIFEKEKLNQEEEKLLEQLPLISSEVLANIKEFPYLSKSARSVHERYDGKGYPEKLKGNEIPSAARITAVAASYIELSSKRKKRTSLPPHIIREEFIKEAGLKYDPLYSNALVQLLDNSTKEGTNEIENEPLEKELSCGDYRSATSIGIPVSKQFTNISFRASARDEKVQFSAPSIILFDSYDRRVHENQKTIDAYHYMEYAEIWFDGHYISTSARNMEIKTGEKTISDASKVNAEKEYDISCVRFEDHLLLKMESLQKSVEVIIALPDVSKAAYIGITGENVNISGLNAEECKESADENTIPRIAEKISYIDRLESDLPNIQITSPRSAYTSPIEIKKDLSITFHTMSLPEASLVWHCPYIILFYSDDGKVGGKNYREYAMIKLNGEDNGSNEYAQNNFSMTKGEEFRNWTEWKEMNKSGYECRIDFLKKGSRYILTTSSLGIHIENICSPLDEKSPVYVTLSGDQCALTDIRVK